ncbi:MAG TPA: polysaccharide lyase family protein [Acidobacteriaceae bacterium]|jgi:hypothetical protein|nr:polysaccharide lyase family protein [Acidobacteriaceae bacterium]
MALFCVVACCVARGQQRVVWQIGTFDDSSGEFRDSHGVDYANAASDVDFTVGKSSVDDWLRFQPGPANGLAGGRLHPFRIHFQLESAPRGAYVLRLAVLYETPRLSSLDIEVNGHRGHVRFEPTLDYAAGDWEGTFVPQTSHAERDIAIDAAWLHEGANEITLTAVDDPATPQNSLGDIAPGDSGLVYDALALLQDPAGHFPVGTVDLKAEATIFFTKRDGALREIVRACVDASGGRPLPRKVAWSSSRFAESQSLDFGGMEFGEACARFDVPEWSGRLPATLRVGGHTFPVDVAAQRKWTMLIVPGEHLDVGFTDYREKVAELQSESIDGVLDLLPAHPDFRWTMDGSWVAQQYMAGRSPARVQQFLSAVRAGQIVVPPQYANQHTGVASLEGLARSLYFSHDLALREKLPLGAANITDVPSYSWSYASILHDAGVRYFAAASNSWRAPLMLEGRWNEKSPFYWEGPDGGRVLMWYSRAYLQLASLFGTPPTVEAVHDALPVFLQAYTRPGYHANEVILYGSQLENTALDREQVTLPAEWAKLYAFPRFEFSTFKAAMSRIESEFGGDIPVYRGDFGPYWEDGFTSDAHATARHRANQQRLLNAEVMSTIPSLLNNDLRPDAKLLQDAWRNSVLFDEHTWTSAEATTAPESDETVRQSRSKRMQPVRAGDDITYSIERSFAQLESFLAPKSDSIVIFNALSWARSGWLETDLPEGKHLVDPETGESVPQEVLQIEPGTALPGFGGRTLRVRYRVDNVPQMGYKLLSIVDGKIGAEDSAVAGDVLENRFYRVTLDAESGSIRSIWDKELKRELVDAKSLYRFASYIYVTGADDMPHNSLYRYGAALPLPELKTHISSSGRIVSIERRDGAEVGVLESSTVNTPVIRTEITLPDNAKLIKIRVSLRKQATLHREAAYIAFPFQENHPEFAYDTQNGWVDPAKDELAGGSREWYATQHWAAVHDARSSEGVICVDAPMVAFGDIVRGAWPTEFVPKTSTIFSWLMSNYWSTNFMGSQGGEYTFRYVIVSDRDFQPPSLTRLGWEEMTPLESDHDAASFAASGANSSSFLSLDNPDVVVTAWKRAEDGDGTIVRMVEIAGRPETVHLRTPHLQLRAAEECSLVEDCSGSIEVQDGRLALSLRPFEIKTIKLHTAPGGKP